MSFDFGKSQQKVEFSFVTQMAFTYSNLLTETPEQCMKFAHS